MARLYNYNDKPYTLKELLPLVKNKFISIHEKKIRLEYKQFIKYYITMENDSSFDITEMQYIKMFKDFEDVTSDYQKNKFYNIKIEKLEKKISFRDSFDMVVEFKKEYDKTGIKTTNAMHYKKLIELTNSKIFVDFT